MTIDLSTEYGGLKMKSPIIVGSCPLTADEFQRIGMVSNNAGAIVLPSLFSSTILPGQAPQLLSDPNRYIDLIKHVSGQIQIPVIASIQGKLDADWSGLPSRLIEAGAAAIELSVWRCPTKPLTDPREIEASIVSQASYIHSECFAPVFVKVSRELTSISHLARTIFPNASGLVLFGRSPMVDIELDSLKLSACWGLSAPGSVAQSLETLIRVRDEFPQIGLAACGGVSTSSDLIKALLAGADAAMVTSAIYRKGPAVIGCFLQGLTNFMNTHGVVSLEELKSLRPQVADLQQQVDIVGCELETANNDHAQPELEPVAGDRFGHPN